MKCNFGLIGLVGAAATACVGLAAVAAGPPDGSAVWHRNLKEAHSLSLERNQPLVVVISADWCPHCRKLWDKTLNDSRVAGRLDSDFVPVVLDLDRHKDVARVLEVKSIPATIVLSPRADLLGRITGYVPADGYLTALAEAQELQQRLDSDAGR